MKRIVYLLITVLIWMSSIPCTDGVKAKPLKKQQTTIVQQSIALEQSSHTDHCGIVCGCSCCGITMRKEKKPSFLSAAVFFPSKKKQAFYSLLYSFRFNRTIWQPPNRHLFFLS